MTTPPHNPYGTPAGQDPWSEQPPAGEDQRSFSPGSTVPGPSSEQAPHGQPGYGQQPYPSNPYDQPPYGQPQHGQGQYGQPPYGQPQYGQGQYGPGSYGPPPQRGTNGLAIATLVISLVGGFLAIPFGHVARRQIRRTGEQGAGLALAGLIIGYLALAVGALVIVLLVVGLSLAGDRSTASAQAPGVVAEQGTDPQGTDTGDLGGELGVDVEVGECIRLSGTADAATADPADCGSTESNYVVVGRTPTSAECISDIDASYSETEAFGTDEVGALCLDVDWVEGDCFELAGEDPQRVGCAEPGQDVVRVAETLQGTSDSFDCPQGGYEYGERDFVVCLETVVTS